jgi:hypothetical protein
MGTKQNYIRPIHPWKMVTANISDVTIEFERTIYNKDKKDHHHIIETLDFSQTNIPEYTRLCLITYIFLGKISPLHTQSIISEYKLFCNTEINHTPPRTLRDFLPLLSIGLPDVFDDPLQGVLTGPFHDGLFGRDKKLIEALESISNSQNDGGKEPLMLYVKTYTKCRQYILDMAFGVARNIPSLTNAEIHSGEEFFTWWRRQWNWEIRINVSEAEVITLLMPSLSEKLTTVITKIIQGIADDYGRLACLLGRPQEVVKDFIQAFVIELNDGLINLPLNQYGRQLCPVAKNLETGIKSSAGYPTVSPYIKEVNVAGHVLEDVFKRFFSVREKGFLLPRTQSTIIISQLGSCPFPDYGFMEMDSSD